jgi:type I restriction enzyme, S subunit
MNIIIPSLFEQKKISEILLSFDNKINILEKQNKTLENIGQVIFKSCFEDYDDFKDNLIESEMGMIPIGWKTGILKDIVTINNKNMSAKSMDNKLIIHYSIPNYDKQLFP